MNFHPGDIVKFTYTHQTVDAGTGGKFKEVLVLHANWHNKMHGIDLNRLDPAERKVLEFLLDPKKRNVESKIPLINRVRKTMDPIEEVQNPQAFYTKFVKPFLKRTHADAYRQYVPKLMASVVRVRDGRISTGKPAVKNPLFGQAPDTLAKPGQKAGEPKALTAIDQMKQAQQQHGGKTSRVVQQARKLSPQAAKDILKRFGG